MRKVEVLVLCDAHMAWESVEHTDDVESVSIGGRELDLCSEHRQVMGRVHALWAEWSAPVGGGADVEAARGGRRARARRERAAAAAAPEPASTALGSTDPVCPLCTASFASTPGLTAHLRRQHDTSVEAVYGLVCPLCGHKAVTGRALGIHARTAHGIDGGVVALFARAEAEGDPHGVIASRARALAAGG